MGIRASLRLTCQSRVVVALRVRKGEEAIRPPKWSSGLLTSPLQKGSQLLIRKLLKKLELVDDRQVYN